MRTGSMDMFFLGTIYCTISLCTLLEEVTSVTLVLYVFFIYINVDSTIVHMESLVDRVGRNGSSTKGLWCAHS
jgi:hypothetical protein